MVGPGGCHVDVEECHCSCHEPGSSKVHNVPCCNICPCCLKRIEIIFYEGHVKRCADKQKTIFDAVKKKFNKVK